MINDTAEPKRVAFFQARWKLQSHVLQLAQGLAARGHIVDFFLERCDSQFVDVAGIAAQERIRLRRYPPGTAAAATGRLKDLGRRLLRLKPSHPFWSRNGRIVPWAVRTLENDPPDWLIGVEKQGLVWAGRVAQALRRPLFYHSLEIYPDECPPWSRRRDYSRLRALEKRYHRQARATVIQDPARARELLKANGIERQAIFFLPVALSGASIRQGSDRLQGRLGIDPQQKVLLYYGLLHGQKRLCLEIARQATRLPPDWTLVFHGHGARELVGALTDLGIPRLRISTDLCPESQVPELIASATVGLAIYNPDSANNRLTAFSSEKVALYLRCGLPLIAMADSNFPELFNRFRCGETIAEPGQLPGALAAISQSIGKYRDEAFSAYEALYRIENYVDRFADFLQSPPGPEPAGGAQDADEKPSAAG